MTYVALLRGINVGGNRKVEMKQLKAVFEQAGMSAVRTYINSGNVIFQSALPAGELLPVLESAIAAAFGFPVRVILRDAGNIARLAAALPPGWNDGPDAKCDVMFLGEEIDRPEILAQLDIRPGIDDVRYESGAILWYVARSKVTRSGMLKLVGTKLYANMTIRNCNTLRKLDALMQSGG